MHLKVSLNKLFHIDQFVSDVRDKARTIRNNQIFIYTSKIHELAKDNMSLFECIDLEIASNIFKLNGKNNSGLITY